ncbi:MAG: DegV family protein [Candidatus Aquilonibacter sp.]
MGVTVVTDSGSDLSRAEATSLGIEIVPVSILLGEDRFRDGIDIDRATFFTRVAAGEIPKTESPSQAQFHEVFARATGAGNDVVAIVLSSKISQSYANALAAAKEFGAHVHVVDSLGSAGAETLLSLYASELAKGGTSLAEIVKRVDPRALKSAAYFAMHDIATLGRSGRLPAAVVALGSLTNVRLVLKFNEEGVIVPAGQSFSFDKTCELMVEAVGRAIEHAPNVRVSFGHTQAEDAAVALKKMFQAKLGHAPAQEYTREASLTIATHQGVGALGIYAIVP